MTVDLTAFENLADDAKVWVYQADRAFTSAEKKIVEEELISFVHKWTAHGAQLTGVGALPTDYHIVIAVDGDVQASGCSIDTSVRFIKSLGSQLQIDFFNRLKILAEENEKLKYVPFAKLSEVKTGQYFNPMVSTVSELKKNWFVAVPC